MITKKIKQSILSHAKEEYPNECCGIISKGIYYECRNIAKDKTKDFFIHPDDLEEFKGNIEAIVHSHPDASSKMSESDRVYMESCKIPYVIIGLYKDINDQLKEEYGVYAPSGYQAPLLGRKFVHGVLDCYALVRDFYLRELGITLMDFEREDGWWNNGKDSLYEQHFKEAGFSKVYDLKYGDMIVCSVESDVPNHALIFLGEDGALKSEQTIPCIGVNLVLHHLYGRKSVREMYGEYWESKKSFILRHEDMMK